MSHSNRPSRRDFLRAAGAASAAGLLGSGFGRGSAIADSNSPPNVLLLMTDQQTGRALSCMGHPHVRTPHLDRLAAEGVLFENALCTYPVCTASRGSIVTGRWPHVQGPHLNVGAPEEDPEKGLAPDTVMTESLLHAQGYTTVHHGKWHLGGVTRHPCYNWREGIGHYYQEYSKDLQVYLKEHPVDAPPGDATLYGRPLYMTPEVKRAHEQWDATAQDISLIGRMALPLEADKTVWVTDRLLSDLGEYSDGPLMATWSVDPPHAFWAVQEPYYSAVDIDAVKLPPNQSRPRYYQRDPACKLADVLGPEGMREYLRCYYGLVNQVDDQVGRILGKLEELGRLDETLIVFTSDHGDMNGAHQSVGKGLSAFWDEVVNVPLIVRYPKAVAGGRRVNTHVSGVDIMPTILDYCGLEPPAQCQGTSLRALIEGPEHLGRPGFCERTHPTAQAVGRMIRTHEWKLVVNLENWSTKGEEFKHRCPAELYNLLEDPGEETNLAPDPKFADVKTRLADRLLAWMRDTDDAWLERVDSVVAAG